MRIYLLHNNKFVAFDIHPTDNRELYDRIYYIVNKKKMKQNHKNYIAVEKNKRRKIAYNKKRTAYLRSFIGCLAWNYFR